MIGGDMCLVLGFVIRGIRKVKLGSKKLQIFVYKFSVKDLEYL